MTKAVAMKRLKENRKVFVHMLVLRMKMGNVFDCAGLSSISRHGTWINGRVRAIGQSSQRNIELITDKGTFEVATGMTTIKNASDVRDKLDGTCGRSEC